MNRIYEVKTTDSGSEPVTLAEVQEWCSVSSSDYDNILTNLIKVARKRLESFTHVALVNKTVVVTAYLCQKLVLPYPKIGSISSVEYKQGYNLDGSENWQTITDYSIVGEEVQYFEPVFDGLYRITYTSESYIAEELKTDVCRIVNWMFRNRGDETDAMPQSLMDNAKQYKLYTWG